MKKNKNKVSEARKLMKSHDAVQETMELLSNPAAMKTLRAAKRGKLAYKELNLADENFGL